MLQLMNSLLERRKLISHGLQSRQVHVAKPRKVPHNHTCLEKGQIGSKAAPFMCHGSIIFTICIYPSSTARKKKQNRSTLFQHLVRFPCLNASTGQNSTVG